MKPRTLDALYRDLHQTEGRILACRPGRIGSRWMARRVERQRLLRSEVDGLVKYRAATRRLWSALS